MQNAQPSERGSSPFSEDILAIVTELTNKLTLNAGVVPETVEKFWRQIGATMSLAVPEGTPTSMARAVLEHLNLSWDSDYEDGEKPSLQAYESLIGKIVDRERGEEDDDEDDDATGDLAAEQQILVAPIDLSVSTLIEWIEGGTLVLDPDWQRGYVWKTPRKRRFIESMFMALPIPPVLLFQDKDSKLYVIDGRQRLETIFRYSLGSKDKRKSFTTFSKLTPGWEEGRPLSVAAGKRFDKLPDEFKRRFSTYIVPARKFMNLERRKLYEVFKRYNTGGDKLNPAEIRNAVYQRIPIHEMIYRLAGEGLAIKSTDPEEKALAARLATVMKGKTQRYGRYNFIGRVLAFSHVKGGSVANAINKLMEDFGASDPKPLRDEFLRSFNKTREWYRTPLCAEQPNGKAPFHEWIATIQMVSTTRALQLISEGKVTEDAVRGLIEREWDEFIQGKFDADLKANAGGVLQDKQNTTTHWERQKEWIGRIEKLADGPGA